MAESTANTPTGNVGAGRAETTSAPDPVTPSVSAPTATAGAADPAGAAGPVTHGALAPEDFRKDGTLRKDAQRDLLGRMSPKSAEFSYSEDADKSTVTANVDGQTVTFEVDGDVRKEFSGRESATDSAIRAFDNARGADSEGV